ncbi:MAG: hypothetical protein V4590_12385 [Bacteroidota bacterium]
MLLNRLTYLSYLLLSKKPFNWKTKRNSTFLNEETLPTLKSRLKFNSAFEVKTTVRLETSHLDAAITLFDILNQYKKPSLLRRYKTAGIKHDRILYKRMVLGLKSNVLYNFINEQMASVTFHISINDPQQLSLVNRHIAKNYLDGKFPKGNSQFTITDCKGNKLMYESGNDVKLIYINNNPEINQNINAALYHDRYSNEKYIDSTKFQLSLL